MNSLAKLLEAALFASPRPMAVEELAALDPEATPAAVQAALEEIREHYDVDGHGVALVAVGTGWQILTRPEYTEAIERAQFAVRPQRLSPAALETLAIIAYRQPIGRAEVAEIRGVDVGAVLRTCTSVGSSMSSAAPRGSVGRSSTGPPRCSSSSSGFGTSRSSRGATSSPSPSAAMPPSRRPNRRRSRPQSRPRIRQRSRWRMPWPSLPLTRPRSRRRRMWLPRRRLWRRRLT